MSTSTLAIPSALPGGLEAGMGMHFGHCDIYTIVQIEDGAIKSVGTLPNVPHQQGGCLAPVQHLASHGVTALLAGGMGMRPLMGFQQAGVSVYYAGNYPTVGLAVQAFLDGQAPRLLHRIHLRRRESLGHWEIGGVREILSPERFSRTPSKPPPHPLQRLSRLSNPCPQFSRESKKGRSPLPLLLHCMRNHYGTAARHASPRSLE